MKLSQSMMKMIVKLLILMMLFVIMFLISSFLYSARYWPDVYNYINANITIKRIPTISEIELTVLEVETYTTETYISTTDADYIDVSTVDDIDIDEFMKDVFDFKQKSKRNIIVEQLKDYIELPPRGIFVDYVFLEEPIKYETSSPKTIEGDENETKELDEDTDNVLKTLVTGIVIEDYLPTTTKKEVSEDPVVTERYYTVQPLKNKESKRCVDEEPNITKEEPTDNIETVTKEYLPEYSTTKEGYLVGEDLNPNNMVNEFAVEPIVITTEANENELVNEDQDPMLMKDSVDITNLSTRSSEDVEMVSGKPEKIVMMPDPICQGNETCKDFARTVFPWVATIFVKNSTKESQFSYYCDGALITERVIVTDARCVSVSNSTWDPENVLVFLGKGNLQNFGSNEKVQKIQAIVLHPHFTIEEDGKVQNDLALLMLEEPVMFQDNIQSACMHTENRMEEAATTAWGLNGALLPIFFNRERGENCYDKDEDIFCATYGNEVALCPSYGGIFASKQGGKWCLQGIFYGDPASRGICFTKDVYYTSLKTYLEWINDTVGMYKNVL